MLNVTGLLCGKLQPTDELRYGKKGEASSVKPAKKPIVVWNITRRCNLACVHCYSDSRDQVYPDTLKTAECKRVIDQLAQFKVPTILFSGGEPLLRSDIFELIEYAIGKKIRAVLSTNGTLITRAAAQKLKKLGISYVGISIDGMEITHDRHRGYKGAFQKALEGIRHCRKAGLKVGLRFTLSRLNYRELSDVLDILESENIPRCCIYHLAYAGRGNKLSSEDLSHEETRTAVEMIFKKAEYFHAKRSSKEILTVDNHADNVLLYLRMKKSQPKKAEEIYQMLKWNGGNQSGIAIGCIDWAGNVHPDQFSMDINLGNVKERSFGKIWEDRSHPLMAKLKNRRPHLEGRCFECQYVEICNGNLRSRAQSVTGSFWAPDPACYLTDAEIGLKEQRGSSAK